MSTQRPSEHQARAADPVNSVWVTASAGSGKTTVLRNRYLRLLLAGTRAERILCLTYTRAAANEMAVRITEQLGTWATLPEAQLQGELAALLGAEPKPDEMKKARGLFASVLDCPGGLRIKTIHAFAQDLLQRFPLEAGVAPRFRLLEGLEQQQAEEAARNALYEAATRKTDLPLGKAVDHLASHFGADGFHDILMETIAVRHRVHDLLETKTLAQIEKELWARHGLGPGATAQDVRLAACGATAFNAAALKDLAAAWQKGGKIRQKAADMTLAWLGAKPAEREVKLDDYASALLTAKGEIRADILKTLDPAQIAALEDEAKRLNALARDCNVPENISHASACLTIAAAYLKLYRAQKDHLAALDYDDLIDGAVKLLTEKEATAWVLYKLDGGLDHIMVDEAQDTSRRQWEIIRALSEEFFSGEGAQTTNRTLFVVGDEKQSIFSFQQADPKLFMAMKQYFAAKLAGVNKKLETVPLHVSYRSVPAVLRAVDEVFANPDVRSGVSSEPVEHQSSRKNFAGHVEVWPLELGKKAETKPWELPEEYNRTKNPAATLAEGIAAQVRAWLDQKEFIPSLGRAVQPGDIMVLVQSRNHLVHPIVRALKRRHVPVGGVDRMELTNPIAVQDLLALIQFALLPEDDLTLASVLRGPFIGASEDDLFALATGRAGQPLWACLQAQNAYSGWAAYLREVLARADQANPLAFLLDCLDRPCPASSHSGRRALFARLGADAADPVEELLNAAQTMETQAAHGLQHFLNRMQRTASTIKREQDQGEGQVRVMTVHGAKGLQAPIVILPDTVSMPERRRLHKLNWDEQGLPVFAASGDDADALGFAVREEEHEKHLEEHRRLLYVALTRAADRLYVCGFENMKHNAGCWYDIILAALEKLHSDKAPEAARTVPGIDQSPLVVMKDEQVAALQPKGEEGHAVQPAATLPPWAVQPLTVPYAGVQAQSPSHHASDRTPVARPVGGDNTKFARGRAIHRLLQILPMLNSDAWPQAGARIVRTHMDEVDDKTVAQLIDEATRIMRDPQWAVLFGEGSRAEVPLIGMVDGVFFAGQVDRLCVRSDAVWIVDYKTDRPPPDNESGIPESYRAQLAAYKALLRPLYPQLPVRTFLLWTYAPKLMEVQEKQALAA